MDPRFILVFIFLHSGVNNLMTGIKSHRKGHWLYKEGKHIEGSITKVNRKQKGRGFVHYPVINFKLGDQEITQELTIRSRSRRSYKRGDEITVVYDPDDPEYCEIDGRLRLVIFPITHCIIGYLLVAVGLTLFVFLI